MNIQFIGGFVLAVLMGIILFTLGNRRLKRLLKSCLKRRNHFAHLAANTSDFIYYYQIYPKYQFKYLSPSAENLFGPGSIKRAYQNPNIHFTAIHPDDYEILCKKLSGKSDYSKAIVQRWRDLEGRYKWFEEYAAPIYERGRLVALQGVVRNIDDKVKLQREVEYQLTHDVLTGIYNRTYFEDRFAEYNEEVNTPVGIVLCDLDDLKYTNDRYGHKQGDALIIAAADFLNQYASDRVTVARIGGDEFVLLIAGDTEQDVNQHIHTLLHDFNQNEVNFSVGYAYSSHSKDKMTGLFIQADQDMYRNKKERKRLCKIK